MSIATQCTGRTIRINSRASQQIRASERKHERDDIRRFLIGANVEAVLNETHECIHAAIVEESEASTIRRRKKIHADLVVEISQALNFERKNGGAFDGGISRVAFAVRAAGSRSPVHASPTHIHTDTAWQRMTMDATRRALKPEARLSVLRVASRKLRASGERAVTESFVACERNARGKSVADRAEWIRREADCREEVFKLLHLIRREDRHGSLKVGERAVEFFKPIAVAAPMKRFVPDDVLQGLRRHRAFHRMKTICRDWNP